MRVRPNTITSASAIVLIGSGAAFGLDQPRLGAAWLLLSGLLDILDGQVARGGGMVSTFGGFFDSTLDRVGEAVLYGGIAVYFQTAAMQRDPVLGVVLCLAVLTGSFLVSYTRARAEGLGLECRVGLAQRPERILGVGAPTLFLGAGPHGLLLLAIIGVLAVLSWITVVQRVRHVFRLTNGGAARPASDRPETPASVSLPKGS
jgi:CDP-diacylglycerol--glycerol-3-phosphate 3-phosphatidyltransferase